MWKGELGWQGSPRQALGKVWNSKVTKTCMYEVLVLRTLPYNTETWTMKEKPKQRLRVFEMACLRKIEGVTRRDRIRNEEILNRLKYQNWNSRQNTEQMATIVWTSESDEE